MNHTTIAGKHLGGLDPFVFGEIGRYVDVFVVVLSSFVTTNSGTVRTTSGLICQPCASAGAAEEAPGSPLFVSVFYPSVDGRDFPVAQATVIAELTERGSACHGGIFR